MRLNPDDYAFLASYAPARVARAAQARCAQLRGSFLSIVIMLAITGMWWYQSGRPRPVDSLTWQFLSLLAASVIVTVVAGVAAWATAGARQRMPKVAIRFTGLGGLGLPIAIWWLVWHRLSAMPLDAAAPGWYGVLTTVFLVLAIAATACWAAAIVLGVLWVGDRTSLGWTARRLSQTVPILALGPALPAAVVWMAMKGQLTALSPAGFGWLNDSQIWFSGAFVTLTLIAINIATLQAADLGVLATSLQQRPALRIDPLGLVLDDVSGPVRVPWASVRSIGAKSQGLLPGPQLCIRRDGAPDWLVPISFLDVMPGTIDSAIRAHTNDRRTLDLSRLDRVW